MDHIPQIAAVLSFIIGAGGVTVLGREWLRLRHYRYLYDQAVLHGQKPDVIELIEAELAKQRDPDRPTDQKQLTTGDESKTAEDQPNEDLSVKEKRGKKWWRWWRRKKPD
jgi:hypothetical protein